MPLADVVQEIDKEIEKLQQARRLLSNSSPPTLRRSRRRSSVSAAVRAKISKTQKAKWAERRKTQPK